MEVLYIIFFFFFTCPSWQIPISTTADPITKKSYSRHCTMRPIQSR